jgi:hypothetical protein
MTWFADGCLPLADTARTIKNANNAREAAPVAMVDVWSLDEIGTTRGRERSRLMTVAAGKPDTSYLYKRSTFTRKV